MREIRSSGSVGEPVGNRRLYPEGSEVSGMRGFGIAGGTEPSGPLTAARGTNISSTAIIAGCLEKWHAYEGP
jgi:hypothetical protein